MAASDGLREIAPPVVLFRPTCRLLILVGWCLWEVSQRGLAAKVFYQLATANVSKNPLQVFLANLPTILLFCTCIFALLAQFNWSRPLVIVLATWSIVTQLLPDEWFAMPYGGESAWRISVTSAVILLPIVVFAWTFRFAGEVWRCGLPAENHGAVRRFAPPPLLRGLWTTKNIRPVAGALDAWRVKINDETMDIKAVAGNRGSSSLARVQWIRPRGFGRLLPARLYVGTGLPEAFQLREMKQIPAIRSRDVNLVLSALSQNASAERRTDLARISTRGGTLRGWASIVVGATDVECVGGKVWLVKSSESDDSGIIVELSWGTTGAEGD